ncbi:hypothetical protein EPUL_002404 [Erysiphe pulchra]|uniref:Uncharacterized protein n=1 Tax=Erysiphe pulchra TaxID=225359 RepID=A0A2S4PYV6_9PEZI|nr:hypothetical protein EPUL_002404 [Erysiphe pulchra]
MGKLFGNKPNITPLAEDSSSLRVGINEIATVIGAVVNQQSEMEGGERLEEELEVKEIVPSISELNFDIIADASTEKGISEGFNKARENLTEREQIAKEYSKALDEVTCCVEKIGLGHAIDQLEMALAQVIKWFALGEDLSNKANIQNGLAQSIYATHQRDTSTTKSSYAEATKTYLHNVSAAALSNKICLGKEFVKTIQKVKSGLAIVPTTAEQGNNIFEKAQAISSILGGSVEKAEQWMTYVVDHVPRKLQSLNDPAWKEVKSATGCTATRIAWTRKTLENPMPIVSIVVSFTTEVRPFRLFGTSSVARPIIKTPKPTECPKCWAYHDDRICNYEKRCKQCNSTEHTDCQAPPRCTNYKDPHAADKNSCPARPVVRRGKITYLSRSELRKIRQAGHRAWLLLDLNTNTNSHPEHFPMLGSFNRCQKKSLKIFQANTARGHDLAVALACEEDSFRITRWHKLEGNFAGPPIIHEGRENTDSAGNADILRKTLLERRPIEEDIALEPMSVEQYAKLDIPNDVNDHEVERCLIRATNTAPGIDGIQI